MRIRTVTLYLTDVFRSIEKIERYTFGLTFDEFEKNDLIVDGTVLNLEIIGEAISNIPKPLLADFPNIEWNRAIGFRHLSAHEYFGLDTEIIWSIVQHRLEEMKEAVTILITKSSEMDRGSTV